MNASDMAHVSTLLQTALDSVGILVERSEVVQGNIKGWETVPAPGIVGRWLQNGWRVSLKDEVPVTTTDAETEITFTGLRLVP